MDDNERRKWQQENQLRRQLVRRQQVEAELQRQLEMFGQQRPSVPARGGASSTVGQAFARDGSTPSSDIAKLQEHLETERRMASLNTSVAAAAVSSLWQQQQQQQQQKAQQHEQERRLAQDRARLQNLLVQNQLLLRLPQQQFSPQLAPIGAASSGGTSLSSLKRQLNQILLPPASASRRGRAKSTSALGQWGNPSRRKAAPSSGASPPIGGESNRRARFPTPLATGESERKTGLKNGLKMFQERWDAIETFSDRMDDNPKDQEAFVKEFFLRDLYRRDDGCE